MTDPPPRALASVAVIFFVNGAVYGSWVPRLPEIRERVGISLSELGLVLSGAALFALGGTVVAGHVIDRVGSRQAIVAAGLIVVAALVGIGIARNPFLLVTAIALVSAGDVVQDVAMNVQATQLSRQRSTPVVSRLHALWSLGAVLGGLAAARMAAAHFALTVHLWIVALVLAATTIAAVPWLLRVDAPETYDPDSGGRRRDGRAGLALALLGTLGITIEMIPAEWSALRLVEDLDAPPATAGLAFATFSAGMLVGRFVGDAIVARLGARTALAGGSAIAAAGIASGMLGPNVTISTIGFTIAGFGVAPVFPQIYAEAARTPGMGTGVGIAFMTTGQRVGALVLPVAVGLLADLDAFTVGQAAALLTLPSAVAMAVLVRSRSFGWR